MSNTTHSVNDLVLVDVNGQYEYAMVYYVSDTGYIAVETISGGYMGGPIGELTIAPANASVPGFEGAASWAAEWLERQAA